MKRTAIVTGGSRGIGLAIAKQLGLDGYQVVVFATKPLEACMEHLKELEEAGITWHYVSGTIDNREDRKRLVEETLETFGRIDVLGQQRWCGTPRKGRSSGNDGRKL